MLDTVQANPALRHGHMINITRQVMEMGMSTDYAAIRELSRRVYDQVHRARLDLGMRNVAMVDGVTLMRDGTFV